MLATPLKFSPSRSVAILIVVSLFVQIPLFQDVAAKTHVNVYHALLLTLPMLYIGALARLKLNAGMVLILVLSLTTVFAATDYGIGLRTTQLVFVAASFFMGSVYGRRFANDEWLQIFSAVFVCALVFVVLRDIAYASQLASVYTRTGYTENMLYLSTGGRNIEATMLAMISILLIGTRLYTPALVLAALTAGMMQSRAGLIGVAISIAFMLTRSSKSKSYYALVFGGLALLVLVTSLASSSIIDIPLLSRFNLKSEIDLEQNGVGRLALWHYSGEALQKNLFGYGVGNGVPVMERLSGLNFVENNVHNVPLQFLLEGGLQSLAAYLILGLVIVKKKAVTAVQRNIKAYLLCYLALSLIQFSGYEAYLWLFVGAFLAMPGGMPNESCSLESDAGDAQAIVERCSR